MDASAAMFRPTWQQALGRGLYLGSIANVGVLLFFVIATWADAISPPGTGWAVVSVGPAVAGALIGLAARGRTGTQVSSGGIRTRSVFADGVARWADVADMRAERRGARMVVSVYLRDGASVQLRAPYSGGFFAADPKFEGKMFALSHLWRSHRFGGLPG
ncbi:PH domain-containing protein [Actinoplanes sp. NPDC049596]|uniref:PH domain-containing protein n=1 Tax=unclassified Actinoplanes TaxID=2626549 RepID=UPI0034380B52